MVESKKISNKKKQTIIRIIIAAAVLLGGLALIWYYAGHAASPTEEIPAEEPTAAPAPESTPEPEPERRYTSGYLSCPDGLFYPESPMLLAEAAEALERAMGEAVSYTHDGSMALTENSFAELLTGCFPEERVAGAMESIAQRGGSAVTRAEAVVCMNLLMGLPGTESDEAVFPDVDRNYWAREAILTAAVSSAEQRSERPEDGFRWVDGYLYCVDEDGYFLKNRYLGSLFFGPDGRYASGSPELDDYVAALIRAHTDDTMTRKERLRAVYEYTRDSFKYLIRNYYFIGDTGWQLQEALTMFSTGKGNCYCYAAVFWAAARGLGYDAKIVSGTVTDGKPHGWVEIWEDGQRITYDVELEMSYHQRNGTKNSDFFSMTDTEREPQGYVELVKADNLVPRETNEGLRPR